MKRWPHAKTNLNAVTPRSLSQWRYWKMQITMTAFTVEWLRKQPLFTYGAEAKLLAEQVNNIQQAEICRQDCRWQDINHRWTMRWFNRRTRPEPGQVRPEWRPLAMTYDQHLDRSGRLTEA